MRVWIDTNVLLDYLAERQPWFDDAWRIVNACKKNQLEGGISTQSIADMFYILRKAMTESERRSTLIALCNIFSVESVNRNQIIEALKNSAFSDFEDCLQALTAEAFFADYIITRNEKDYVGSSVPAIAPGDFCNRFLNPREHRGE